MIGTINGVKAEFKRPACTVGETIPFTFNWLPFTFSSNEKIEKSDEYKLVLMDGLEEWLIRGDLKGKRIIIDTCICIK